MPRMSMEVLRCFSYGSPASYSANPGKNMNLMEGGDWVAHVLTPASQESLGIKGDNEQKTPRGGCR